MAFKWKWLIFVVLTLTLTLDYSLDVSGQGVAPKCTVCVELKDDVNMKCKGISKLLSCDDEQNIITNTGSDNSGLTTTPPKSGDQVKKAQTFISDDRPFVCAKYEGATKDKPTEIYTIYGCTTLTKAEENKKVADTKNCKSDKIEVKLSNTIVIHASECYCEPAGESCFSVVAGGLTTLKPGGGNSPMTAKPTMPTGRGGSPNTGGSGGSKVRASVGLLLRAIGLFGCHQIQGVQPAL